MHSYFLLLLLKSDQLFAPQTVCLTNCLLQDLACGAVTTMSKCARTQIKCI